MSTRAVGAGGAGGVDRERLTLAARLLVRMAAQHMARTATRRVRGRSRGDLAACYEEAIIGAVFEGRSCRRLGAAVGLGRMTVHQVAARFRAALAEAARREQLSAAEARSVLLVGAGPAASAREDGDE